MAKSDEEKDSGFPGRMERVRTRLGFTSAKAFAEAVGMSDNTYRTWENTEGAPGSFKLKRALKVLRGPSGTPLAGRAQLFDWLPDGDGRPPAWLDDERMDPYEASSDPEDGPGVPAMPLEVLDSVRRDLREVVEGSGPAMLKIRVTRAYAIIEDWISFNAPGRGSRWSSVSPVFIGIGTSDDRAAAG